MVQPDRPIPERRPRQRPRGPVIAATVLVVILGMIGVGALTTPDPADPETAPPTTDPSLSEPTTTLSPPDPDTFRIFDVQRGRQLWWGRGFGPPDNDLYPWLLAELGDEIVLLGAKEIWTGASPPRGLTLWRSEDGVFWTDEGEVLGPEYRVQQVIAVSKGVMALAQGGVMLTSTDGRTWSSEQIPPPPDIAEDEVIWPTAAAYQNGRTFIFGQVNVDPLMQLRPYLPSEVVTAIEDGHSWGTNSGRLTVYGPWGVTVHSVNLAEAGVPLEIRSRLNTGRPNRGYVWWRDPGTDWTVSEFEGDWVESVSIAADGTVEAIGWGPSGAARWTSTDGEQWDVAARSGVADTVVAWREGYIGTRQFPVDLVLSSDGANWEEMGLGEGFPPQLNWWVGPIITAESGVAAFVTGNRPEATTTAKVTVERDGYRLTTDQFQSNIELIRLADETSVFRYTMWSAEPTEQINTDLEARTYTFLDLDSDEPLVTFGFDELDRAQSEAYAGSSASADVQGLFYSRDGVDWTVQDLTETLNGEVVYAALVTEDRVIAATAPISYFGNTLPELTFRVGLIQDRDPRPSG